MEKTSQAITKITLALCLFCALPFAQIPKVAVYVSEQSGYSDEVKNALRVATINVLAGSGKYEVVERSSVIDEELNKQASGAVDDDQMVAFGKQAGARYICVSDIIDLGSYYYKELSQDGKTVIRSILVRPYQVSARIIDVETAQLVGLGVVDQDIQDGRAMSAAITKAVEKMLGTISVQTDSSLPKKAVYVQGERRLSKSALYTYTLEALFTRSRYNGNFVVVERSDAFTKQIDRELGKQYSGSVSDSEISRMGKQYGISEICIASIEPVMGTYNINARLVNVERASVVNASKLRHLKEHSEDSGLNKLRDIAIQMVEDMIPRKISQAELEEEKQAEAEVAEATRTAWMAGGTMAGGVSLNMNEIDPNYFKSLGYEGSLSAEFFKQNLKFFRFGLYVDFGYINIDKDAIIRIQPDVFPNVSKNISLKVGALARLYPVDFLFLSGGAGYFKYAPQVERPKRGSTDLRNPEKEKIDLVSISAPIFPVGGGIVLGDLIVIEALYNIVPFQGRTAKYISINAGIKGYLRLTEDKEYVRKKI